MKFKDIKIGQKFRAYGNEFIKLNEAYTKNDESHFDIKFKKVNSVITIDAHPYCSFIDDEEVEL